MPSIPDYVHQHTLRKLDFHFVVNNLIEALQDFRNSHLLIYGMDSDASLTWSLSSLCNIGNLDVHREISGLSFPSLQYTIFTQCTDHSGQGSGTLSLREIYEETLEENGRVLSALSLPCRTADFAHPLQS